LASNVSGWKNQSASPVPQSGHFSEIARLRELTEISDSGSRVRFIITGFRISPVPVVNHPAGG
jgi:hypothetical protein